MPAAIAAAAAGGAPPPPVVRGISANTRAFTVAVRNALFRRVDLFARRRWWELGQLDGELSGWDYDRWAAAGAEYYAEHADVGAPATG